MRTILYVHARGGLPPGHAVPKVAALASTHLLQLAPLPVASAAEVTACCASVLDASDIAEDELVDLIVRTARDVGADAVLSVSEFALIHVARACDRLGLRGPGPGIEQSRDKRLMRETWQRAGVPVPRFRRVDSAAELADASRELRLPVLLKAALSAGSIGHVVIRDPAEATMAWDRSRRAMELAVAGGMADLDQDRAVNSFLVEEVIEASTDGWYDGPGYGDYCSVEGVVVDGSYHPVCITARLPTIEPFSELANLVPSVLPEPAQRRIEAAARAAVEALGLGTCGTHTELKLLRDGGVCLIESAARLGGVMVNREVETVFGVDMMTSLTRALLGDDPGLPERMLVSGTAAAASLALIATDSRGRPWSALPEFRADRIEWDRLLSAGTTVSVVPEMTVPDGTPMPPYDPGRGVLNIGGVFFVQATSAAHLLRDCYSVLDGMEEALSGAAN